MNSFLVDCGPLIKSFPPNRLAVEGEAKTAKGLLKPLLRQAEFAARDFDNVPYFAVHSPFSLKRLQVAADGCYKLRIRAEVADTLLSAATKAQFVQSFPAVADLARHETLSGEGRGLLRRQSQCPKRGQL